MTFNPFAFTFQVLELQGVSLSNCTQFEATILLKLGGEINDVHLGLGRYFSYCFHCLGVCFLFVSLFGLWSFGFFVFNLIWKLERIVWKQQ